MRDRPSLGELDAVADPDARVIQARQHAAGDAPVAAWRARLAAIAGAGSTARQEARLAAEIRAGLRDGDAALLDHLRATVRSKLVETAPGTIPQWPFLAD